MDPHTDEAPAESLAPPAWLWAVIVAVSVGVGLLLWLFLPHADVRDAAPVTTTGAAGEALYRAHCASCHHANGQGIAPLYPPLAQSRWTTGDADPLIRITLNGLVGEVEVGGRTYNGVMPAWRHLTNEEIADILTYVRSHWGNTASAVTPEAVGAVRVEIETRSAPYTVAELERLP